MRILIFLLLTCFASLSFGQFPNEVGTVKSFKIRKMTITATEYENNKIKEKNYIVNEFDENGNNISFSLLNKKKKLEYFSNTIYFTQEHKEIRKEFNGDSSLLSIYIGIKDTLKNTQTNLQISSNGDTLVYQIRYLNKFGKDSLLYTWTKNSPEFMITGRWDYDSLGNLLSINSQSYYTKQDRDCELRYSLEDKLISKTCNTKEENITYFYEDKTGSLYRVKAYCVAGGKRVATKNEDGLVTNISYTDKKGKILTNIKFEYDK
jgi:hypothetical protein